MRAYRPDPVEEEQLAAILEAGRMAPTACNFQPQRIYVVRTEENRKKLAEICRFTFDAPVILVVGYDASRAWKNKRIPNYDSGETDAAIVTTHMMLAAYEQGIGSCWVGVFDPVEVARTLDLPEGVRVTALMPMGYPADDAIPAAYHTAYRDLEDTVEFM